MGTEHEEVVRARAFFAAGNRKAAMGILAEHIANHPDDAVAWATFADILEEQSPSRAEYCRQRAAELGFEPESQRAPSAGVQAAPTPASPPAPSAKRSGFPLVLVLGVVAAVAVLGLAVALVYFLVLAPSGAAVADVTPVPVPPTATPSPSATPSPTPEHTPTWTPTPKATITPTPTLVLAQSVATVRMATVYVEAYFDEARADGVSGSGSMVDPRGYILTNYHVVADTLEQYIGVNDSNVEAPPREFYRVEVVATDPQRDLALLHVIAYANGVPLDRVSDFPTVTIGDSEQVGLGDAVTILGFPGLGAYTITLTKGTISGFLDDADLGLARGWIKTDAKISPGNSGGVVIDAQGRLIGVPTMVSYDPMLGGELGLVRPINVAYDFLKNIP